MSNVFGKAGLVRTSAALALAAAAINVTGANSTAARETNLRRFEAAVGKRNSQVLDGSVPILGCNEGIADRVGAGCGSMTGGRSGGPDQS